VSNLPKTDTKDKLEISSPEGDFKWRLGGRIHTDAAFYDNDTSTTGEPTGLDSGADIRRARLALKGTLWRNWLFEIEYDFAESGEIDEGLRDAYLRYLLKIPQPFAFTVGQFKEYLGLESWSSSNDLTFIERALPSRAFSPPSARRLGVGVSTYGHDLWTLSAGVYGKNASGEDIGGVEIEDDPDPLVFVGRLTFSPLHTETRVVHLGASGSWLGSGNNLVEFREQPEADIGAERLIDTGEFDADTITRYGVEALAIYGPFSLQGEYLLAHVNRELPSEPDVSFPGWYVYGSWILTGESRRYEFEEGEFKNPKPGVWLARAGSVPGRLQRATARLI
jgi:phosphate-selective porin OprO and OprP